MDSILTPTLVILLGSTPALVELELCQQMLSLSEEDRHRVAFVHIDTAEEPAELVVFHEKHQGQFRRFRQEIAVPVDIDYAPLPTEVWHTYIPSKRPQYYATGAAGIRNNGHVAAAFDWQLIDQAIDAALQAIENLDTTYNQRAVKEVHVNIVAFLGGGTGSGILADVTVLVRQKLIERKYMQRINLFCILPDWLQGANSNDIGRRKSNATACLLELIALSLVADTSPDNVYHKYMLDKRGDVASGTIANEVYLIGRTAIGSIEGTARIVGLDLFQRITDASGVGYLERSEWMNRLTLSSKDDRNLPAMFGTSCPLEVRFPLQEVARAYADLSTAYLLPYLVNTSLPYPDIRDEEREDWEHEWDDVATLEPNVQGKPLAVKPPEEFSLEEFENVGPDTLDSLWKKLQRLQNETDGQIRAAIDQKYTEEKRLIGIIPPLQPNEFISPLSRKINHLRRLEKEYEIARDKLKRSPEEPTPEKPELSTSWRYRIPFFGGRFEEDEIEGIRQDYNEILDRHAHETRHNLLLEKLERLLEQVQRKLHDVLQILSSYSMDLPQIGEHLANAGYNSPAWHGMLERSHPHQRHVFDLREFYDDPDADDRRRRNLASERLYLQVTFGLNEQTINQHIRERDFVARIARERIQKFIPECTAYLIAGEQVGGPYAQVADADLELQSKEHLVERVKAFFYEHYLKELHEKNLFELLRRGSGRGQSASVSDYLYEHLDHIKGLSRSLVGFQQTLWPEGSQQLYTNVYLGLHWKNEEQPELQEAIRRIGAINDRNQTPRVEFMDDPHRLQVSYGQHGISLSTVQEFYRDTNSAMEWYIHHQREWYGNAQPPILPDPSQHTYGSNNIPIHNCGEMERLVCDPSALEYSDKLPHTHKYRTSLIGRVIRETTKIDAAPAWSGTPLVASNPPQP